MKLVSTASTATLTDPSARALGRDDRTGLFFRRSLNHPLLGILLEAPTEGEVQIDARNQPRECR